MQDKINQICKFIEKEKKIRILFAVESGSRVWRVDSKDSDYDVRFVFVRPIDDYIKIDKPIEVIEVFYDKKGKSCKPKGAYIDMVGFDVFKFVKMLSVSNPTTIEWLVSDIVYYGEQNNIFKKFALKNFKKISLYYHYKSMCRINYLKYLKSGKAVTYKKYLYAYRGLVNAKWVASKQSIPPIIFIDTIKQMKGIIPAKVIQNLVEIIKLKSEGKEEDVIQNITHLDNYIEEFIKNDSETPKEKSQAAFNSLNNELRRIVLQR